MIVTIIKRIMRPNAVVSLLIFSFLFFALLSCELPEGPGGKGIIRGEVRIGTFDPKFRVLQSEYPASDEDVYIIYGNSPDISDDRTTGADGKFEFRYLNKGEYRILVYSEDSTGNSPSGMVPVERVVTLSSNSDVVDLGQIRILNTIDVDEGQVSIHGQIMQVIYSRGFQFILDTIPGQDQDVYLIYEDDLHYCERIRSLFNGSFAFPGMIKGRYSIFVYSEDINSGPELVPVLKEININDGQGNFDVGIFYIAKED